MSAGIKGTMRSGMTIIPKRVSVIGWTPVEEALPEENGEYLVWTDGGKPATLLWHGDYWTCILGRVELKHITHWAEVTPPEVDNG